MTPLRGARATTLVEWVGPLVPPILFAVFPLLVLFAHNQTEVERAELWRPLAICVISAAALYGLFALVFRNGAKAGALASLVIVAFYFYGSVGRQVSGWGLRGGWFDALWLALLVLGSVALVRTTRPLGNLTLFLTICAVVLCVGPVSRITIYQVNHPPVAVSDPRLWPTRLAQPVPTAARRPLRDIYVIIPDDYARPDILRQYFHYEDAAFLRALKKRGFVISDQARSPYSDSEMNIAAELNMDYLNGLAGILGKRSEDVRPVSRLIEDNRAARLLRPLGYRYVHLDTDEVTYAAGNPHISSVAVPDSFANLWLRDTALGLVGGRLGFDEAAAEERFRKSIRSTLAQLEAVPQTPGPKFVVFHTLLPHDPYIFGEHGQAVAFPNRSDEALGSRRGMRVYLQQLKFVNAKLLDVIDTIQAHSKRPPVIVIQSDEGFQANPDDFGEAAMRDIRVKGLTALYLPGTVRTGVPRPPNTVNTLRFVFNEYLGTHYKLLRSASYPELDFPYQFKEMRVRGD